jgi:putative sterol carrier protein
MGTAGNTSPDESGTAVNQSQLEQNKALVRRFVEEIINAGDLGPVVDELFGEEYLEGNFPLDNRTGPEIVRTWIPYLRWVYPDVRHEILDLCAEGNTVICRSIQFGTPRGFLEGKSKGVVPENRVQKRMEINMLRLKDGKFCEHWGPFSRRLDEKGAGESTEGLGGAMERAHKAWAEQEGQATANQSAGQAQDGSTEQIRATGGTNMATIQAAFDDIAQHLAAALDRADGLTATYQYNIEGENGGLWILAFDDGHAKITPGKAENPDVVISVDEVDMLALASRELTGVEAFMTGKLRVEGDPVLGMRLGSLLGDA